MPRRVVETRAKSIDHEPLVIITVFEEGIKKEQTKKENFYSKRHYVLVPNGKGYDFK